VPEDQNIWVPSSDHLILDRKVSSFSFVPAFLNHDFLDNYHHTGQDHINRRGWHDMQGVRGSMTAASNGTSRSLAWHVRAIEASGIYLRRRYVEAGRAWGYGRGAKSSHGSYQRRPCDTLPHRPLRRTHEQRDPRGSAVGLQPATPP
jgi:hypothetical protein